MKDKIIDIIRKFHLTNEIKTYNEAAEQILRLFDVSGSCSADELEEMKRLAHEGLPDDCVKGWGEVKFCENRQGDGNMCKWCSNYL